MPHGLIDSATYLYNEARFYYNGILWSSSSNMFMAGLTQSPASTNNPKVLGVRPDAAWYAVRARWTTSDGNIVIRKTGETCHSVGQLSSFNEADGWHLMQLDPNLADNLLRTVLSDMLEKDVAFNAFMLQGKQSLKMVANLATGIAVGTDRLLTTEFKHPRTFRRFLRNAGDKAVSKFSGKYLEYLYGWKPLADDVENAFQSMIDGYTGPEQKRFRLKVRKSKRVKSDVVANREAQVYFTPNWSWKQTLSKEQRVKILLKYQFPSQAGEMLPTMTPFGTAWELAPWSFVLDWFVPVGDWIGAMEATQYAVYMQNAVLTKSVKVASRGGSRSTWNFIHYEPGWETIPGQPPRLSGYQFTMSREVLSPSAVLDRIRFPDFSSKFGLPQASQALALLSQVLNKWF